MNTNWQHTTQPAPQPHITIQLILNEPTPILLTNLTPQHLLASITLRRIHITDTYQNPQIYLQQLPTKPTTITLLWTNHQQHHTLTISTTITVTQNPHTPHTLTTTLTTPTPTQEQLDKLIQALDNPNFTITNLAQAYENQSHNPTGNTIFPPTSEHTDIKTPQK